MSQAKTQFERVTRAFQRVLNNQNRNPVEYEDDVWSFFQNCWHLKDWIKNDVQAVSKATRLKIDVEVKSYPALMMMGDLAEKSKDLELTNSPTPIREAPHTHSKAGATAYIDRRGQTREAGKADGAIYLLVTDKNGDKFPVKKLATDAMKNWMAIIKKYRI
jgi:hypothetical protein